ncbi:MAG: HAD family phosphatase [Candidatus Omnitrophica bacterium]|nr:HAD family phosphatase [Candidatus Omnitrophota bacterium]MBU1922948.1 HAD family phosphatase [Candidatus Omnitrophota bacterium]
MPEARIKVILFDLGNVLVDFDLRPAAERISSFCSKGPDEILKLLFDSGVTNSFEKGKISAEEFYKKAKDILDLKLGYESFVPIWNEVFFFSPKNRAVYHIANCLKKNYRIALLSNTNILHYRYIKDNFPVFNVFERLFLSFEIGAIKPNKIIYQKVIKVLHVLPENVFYTDDRPELVNSASGLGIKSFIFTSIKQLIKDLSSQSIVLGD